MGRAQDRISELPDVIRLQILSHVSRKYAIRTSVLSSRWKDLWKYRWPYSTSLDFGKDFATGLSPEDFVSFANRTLSLRGEKKVEIFQLFFSSWVQYRSDALRFIEYAIKNGVEELYLDFSNSRTASDKKVFELPDCLFQCESITSLNLKCCCIDVHVDFRSLIFLETLCLDYADVTDETVIKVIECCPFLENLDLRKCYELRYIKVSGENLRVKRLVVIDCWKAYKIEISAPNLQCFYFVGEFLQDYSFGNLSSLINVTMSSAGWDRRFRKTNWSNIVPNIANTHYLTLCSQAVQQIALWKISMELVFNNLQELYLIMDQMTYTNLSDIYDFFSRCNCPKLVRLFIDLPTNSMDPLMKIYLQTSLDERPIKCNLDKLKNIQMKHFKGHKYEIELVKFFLESATILETITIITTTEVNTESVGTPECLIQLNSIKKASEIAKIILCSDRDQYHYE